MSEANPQPPHPGLDRESTLRALLGLLAHEMRTPLGAIVGYSELLTDGLLGPLPDRAADAIHRMSTAGGQLRHLIDGLSDLMVGDGEVALELEDVDVSGTAAYVANSARALANGRGVKLEIALPEHLPTLHTDAARLAAALDLAVGAAIRASPGASVRLVFVAEDSALSARVEGTALDAARDMPTGGGEASISTAAGLRLLMAGRMLRLLGGGARIDGSAPSTLVVWAPSASIDAPEGLP